jgi:hypothetical protein
MLFLRKFDEVKVIQLTSEGLLPEIVRFYWMRKAVG